MKKLLKKLFGKKEAKITPEVKVKLCKCNCGNEDCTCDENCSCKDCNCKCNENCTCKEKKVAKKQIQKTKPKDKKK